MGQPTTIDLLAAATGDVSLAVKSASELPAGTRTGFALEIQQEFLDVDLLDNIEINTFLAGMPQESFTTSSPLVSLNLFGNGSNISFFSVPTTLAFDEVQLNFDASIAGATVGGGLIKVYYAYIQRDLDNDGTPDCLDKCCAGNDNDDVDGDGQPLPCDVLIAAADDSEITPMDTPTDVDFLTNDDFGNNGVGNTMARIISNPEHGVISVQDNSTPSDFSDDFMLYSPALGYVGMDSVFYVIQDANFSEDTAQVMIEVTPINGVSLNLKVFLLGALYPDVSGSGLMRDGLRSLTFIPLFQPYNAGLNSRFTQVVGGTELTTPAILDNDAGTGDAVVDWIFVELRDAADSTIVIRTISALLQRDGDIVNSAGAPLVVPGLPNEFYVAIKHRNHLGVMTSSPVDATLGTVTVDFTTISSADLWNQAGYDGVETYTLMNGAKALWSANTSADNKVKYQGPGTDASATLLNVLTHPDNMEGTPVYNFDSGFGYYQGDINLDGKVKYQGSDNDLSLLFLNVLTYPLNTSSLYNYDLMLEQLPE